FLDCTRRPLPVRQDDGRVGAVFLNGHVCHDGPWEALRPRLASAGRKRLVFFEEGESETMRPGALARRAAKVEGRRPRSHGPLQPETGEKINPLRPEGDAEPVLAAGPRFRERFRKKDCRSARAYFVAVQFCMMNVWPATTPSPVMFAPTSASRVSSRKALPPDRRRMNSLPCGVRRTTPRCSLLEPGETIADATFPVIVWSCACISPSHVFCDSDQAIVLRVGDEDTGAPQAFWHMGRGLIVFHEHQHFLCRPALLHRGAIIALADNLKRGQILGAGAEASFLGDPEHRGAQATWGRGKSFPGVARTVGGRLSGSGQGDAAHGARRAAVNQRSVRDRSFLFGRTQLKR